MFKVGVNSCIVKEITGRGLSLAEMGVDVIELGFDDLPLIVDGKVNYDAVSKLQSLDVEFTIHAPTSDAKDKPTRVDLGTRSKHNMKVMKNVFEIASLLNAKCVVVHGGDIKDSYQMAFLNTKMQLAELSALADDYSVNLCLENLEDNRIGALPYELLPLIGRNMTVTLDVGHAFLVSLKYGMPLQEFFNVLGMYTTHVHLHDNLGFADNHLAFGEGIIDMNYVLNELVKLHPKNVILEIINYSSTNNILRSINNVSIAKELVLVTHKNL
ncbi:MAG: sugar phosphate isomerase/epimerase family protein [Candidatus Asgardarchaeia archaeon]